MVGSHKGWRGVVDSMSMDLPARLDCVLEEVSTGCMLKHARSERRALIVDFADKTGNPIVVFVRRKVMKGKKIDAEASDYRVKELKESKLNDWLVVTLGTDRSLA
jgi:hypothetical protein